MAETIAVLSLKGGTGKTTTVRTLADVLRRVGLDVLTIDLDPQGNLSDYFDVPPDATPTIADVLVGDAKAKAAIHDGIVRSAGVITSAALVMVAVFLTFATLKQTSLKQLGVGLAVAVLLDATVVRALLLPATMKLLGERNWFMPRFTKQAASRAPEAPALTPSP